MQATGTTNYLADAETGYYKEAGPQESLPTWDMVHGELFSFDNPEERLPALDGLEGFRPCGEGFYKRVLVPATLTKTGTTILAWTYVIESAFGDQLPGGCWPAN